MKLYNVASPDSPSMLRIRKKSQGQCANRSPNSDKIASRSSRSRVYIRSAFNRHRRRCRSFAPTNLWRLPRYFSSTGEQVRAINEFFPPDPVGNALANACRLAALHTTSITCSLARSLLSLTRSLARFRLSHGTFEFAVLGFTGVRAPCTRHHSMQTRAAVQRK